MRKTETVRIRDYGVDKPFVQLSKNRQDEMTWESEDIDYDIHFVGPRGSPFVQGADFTVRAGGPPANPGAIKEGAAGRYQYYVGALGGAAADPAVDIIP